MPAYGDGKEFMLNSRHGDATMTQNTTDNEQPAPERIRLLKRDGLLVPEWFYTDAAVGPYDAEFVYFRAFVPAVEGDALDYAQALALQLSAKHFPGQEFQVLDTVIGVLTQIDNMTTAWPASSPLPVEAQAKCVKCGHHRSFVDNEARCSFGRKYHKNAEDWCGCKCEFTATAEPAQPDGEQEPSLEDLALQVASHLEGNRHEHRLQLAHALRTRVASLRAIKPPTAPVVAREIAEEILRDAKYPGRDEDVETIAAIISKHFPATPSPVPETASDDDPLTDAQVDAWLEAHKNDPVDPAQTNRIEWLFRKKLAASIVEKAKEWLRSYDGRIAEGGKGAHDMERLYGEEAAFRRDIIRAVETLALEPLTAHVDFVFDNMACCKVCGLVRPAEGWTRPCKGPTDLSLRAAVPETPVGGEGQLHYPFSARHANCTECDREFEPPPTNCIHRIGMGGMCDECAPGNTVVAPVPDTADNKGER